MKKRAFKIFSSESKQDTYSAKRLLEMCFSSQFDKSIVLNFTQGRNFLQNNHKAFWTDSNLNNINSYSSINSLYSLRKFFFCVHCGLSL